MEFEYDDHQANLNLAKHGVDFADAVRIFSDPFRIEQVDERFDYQEIRLKVIGRVDNSILLVIYTERDSKYRIMALLVIVWNT